MRPTVSKLRRAAVARTLFESGLQDAVRRLGFVQADPIRAPARAQDLVLRHRVAGYRAGELEQRYPELDLEEGFFVNYGFVSRDVYALMQPRARLGTWPAPGRRMAEAVRRFVIARGRAHPREVDAHFAHGPVTNYWGGSSSATTHLLDHLHYRGLLRVAGRDGGIRIYAPPVAAVPARSAAERRMRIDALVDVAVLTYAPLPSPTLSWLLNRLRISVPQWEGGLRQALQRARRRLAHVHVDGVEWYWPVDEVLQSDEPDHRVRLLAPFDPIVWDRRRFQKLWNWEYRFEAYTPASKRKFGYYALPMLWRDQVIGWANAAMSPSGLRVEPGFVAGRAPRERAFARELEAEIERLRAFLVSEGSGVAPPAAAQASPAPRGARPRPVRRAGRSEAEAG